MPAESRQPRPRAPGRRLGARSASWSPSSGPTTGAGAFWPGWVWMALAAAIALHVALRWALPLEPVGVRAVAILGSISAILFGTHFVDLGPVGRRLLLAAVPGARDGDRDGAPRHRRLPRAAVGLRPRAGADRAGRRADPHAARRRRGPGRRAAADRARPARRRAGAAGRAQHAARPGRGAARRPARGRRPRAAGARRGRRRDRRAARPRPRDRPAGPRRPRPGRRGRVARPARAAPGHGDHRADASGRCPWSRRRRTSSSPSR